MRRTFLILACVSIVSGAGAIPFELTSNKIYLPVKVNGKGPYSFILDTGSIWNVVDTERAKLLKIATSGGMETHGAGDGSLSSSTAKDVDLSANGSALRKQEVAVMPINQAISFSEGRTINGLLGCAWFEHFVVEIDYANAQVRFHEPGKFQFAGQGEAIPIELERGNIFIRANVVLPNGERVAGKFLVDTGWRNAISFTSPFAREHKLPAMTHTIVATSGVGIGGPVTDMIGRINALEIGRHVIKTPVANFSQATTGILAQSDFVGIIGAEVLRRFHVVFDYPQKRMLLQPNAHFDEWYEFDMTGIYLTAQGKDFKEFKVFKMMPDSPAGVAGLREGDQLLSIDNQPSSKFTLEQIRQMFRQEGKTYSLRILRGENMVQTQLTTRRLI